MTSTTTSRIVYAKNLFGKAKALVALAIPVAQIVQAAVTDNEITSNEWTKIAIAVVGAIGVYFTPNQGGNLLTAEGDTPAAED